MNQSLIIALNDYCILEYTYRNGVNDEIFDTNKQKIKIINNAYVGEKTLINDGTYQKIKTGNIQDNAAVIVADGSYVHLDRDGRSYPDNDSNILLTNAIFPVLRNVIYENVRIHILAGYNFQDTSGFIVSIYGKLLSGKNAYLCNFAYLKEDIDNLYFNPKPLKLSDKIYDKYVQVKIPSMSWIIDEQENNVTPSTRFSNVCFGQNLKPQSVFYCDFKFIESEKYHLGYRYLYVPGTKKLVLDIDNNNNLLGASITENPSYFSLKPTWDGQDIEDYLYKLNSIAGNNYFLIHEIKVVEQYGALFVETSNQSFIQTGNYSDPYDFRPVLKNNDGSASSFSIDYTARLYNSVDGRSIFAEGSVTSYNVNRYSKNNFVLNVGNTSEPFKVYNKEVKQIANITDRSNSIIQNKLVVYFVDKSTVQLNVADTQSPIVKFTPFISIINFNVTDANGGKVDVSYLNNPLLSIVKDDGNKIYISEYQDANFDKTKGALAFKFTGSTYNQIKQVTDQKYYVVNRDVNGEETLILAGTFEIS
jgi:hypothetical protein